MKTPIENILANYFAGEASAEEIVQAETFRKRHAAEFAAWEKAFHQTVFETKKFDTEKAKQKMLETINIEGQSVKTRNLKIWLKIAAVFTGLLLVGAAYYFSARIQPVTIENSTAQLKTVTLPDGTQVILDKNTTLSYETNLWGSFQRKVNMSGRAFFHVTKDAAHPFNVYAGEITVTVLGTRFTVNELNSHTQVFLTEGKVRVESEISKRKFVITKPGEQVIVDKKGELFHNRINPSLYASWKANKVHFNNCTVKEVVQFLDDSYGVEVNITDKSMLNRKLFGSAPTDDEELIIKALSEILQTNIESK